jgi:hypothetical protein
MAYIVCSTEGKRGKGADYETKALLYLMGGREDSHEIHSFAIDFYNDVTGLDIHSEKAWDVQSKGSLARGNKEIGRELVTLYKNYTSELIFDYLILFIAGVPDSFRKDNEIKIFGIENIKEDALTSVKNGLRDECNKKTYIQSQSINEKCIDDFLGKVTFVIDDKTKSEYVKSIINFNSSLVPDDAILDGIFNKIRDAQSSKKNNTSVEGERVIYLRDVNKYDRVITTKEIRLMVINTIVNRDIVRGSAPTCFYPLIQEYDALRRKEIIEDCQLNISVALFDKNNSDSFWDLLNLIVETISEHKELETLEIYDLMANNEIIEKTILDVLSIQYLVSLMKEALE